MTDPILTYSVLAIAVELSVALVLRLGGRCDLRTGRRRGTPKSD